MNEKLSIVDVLSKFYNQSYVEDFKKLSAEEKLSILEDRMDEICFLVRYEAKKELKEAIKSL